MQDHIGIPACFSSGEKLGDDASAETRSSQSVYMSMYRTNIADQSRLITIAWCKKTCSSNSFKVELKPWYFWRKQGSKRFAVDGKAVEIFWDLKAATPHHVCSSHMVGMSDNNTNVDSSSASYETLLCWVLVDPLQRHGFCSRADFSKEPAFSWMSKLSGQIRTAIKQSKILFCNGYGFDELSPGVIAAAVEYAVDVGTAIFFDPGPRAKCLSAGTTEEREALNLLLRMSDVLLISSDEV